MLRIDKILTIVFSACLLSALPAFAGSPARTTLVLDLQGCISAALQSAPELGEAQADIQLTSSKLEQAKAHRYPQIEVMSLFGPAPSARREDIAPVVKTDKAFSIRELTWFASTDVLVTQPLWTFGKISENMKAARHGIEVDKAKKQQKANEIALEVKKYYYGYLLAKEIQNVLSELQLYMTQGKQKVKQLIAQESPAGDEMDLFKIDAYSGEVNNYMDAALKGERLALAALKARLGLGENVDIIPSDSQLTIESREMPDRAATVVKAREQRPEFRQLSEGLQARTALVEAAKAGYYPDVFLAGMLSWAYADDRDRIKNPYFSDRFQHTYGGVALGLKWHLDFGITASKVAAEQAQLNRLESTKNYAEAFIPVQVQKALLEMKEAENVVSSSFIAYRSAKKWGAVALANFDFGIGNSRDIFEAVSIYGKMKAAHYQGIHDFNMARANLEYAIGEYPVPSAK